MNNLAASIEWKEKNEIIENLTHQADAVTAHSIEQGFEAEVMRLSMGTDSYVLKIWNKSSRPDVRFQYHLLKALADLGLAVPRPVGWGINPNDEQVLLTTFDGTVVGKVNAQKMRNIALLLSELHRIPSEELAGIQLPEYSFIDYFFPCKGKHPDLHEAVSRMIDLVQLRQDRIIHGDFHLNNLLEDNDRYTIIDWTNAQLGDSRYDFAWALVLLRIYLSDRNASAFRSAYLADHPTPQEELEIFEAIAYLRWIYLYRCGGTPTRPGAMTKVKALVRRNRHITDIHI